jgi:hypothetical protein
MEARRYHLEQAEDCLELARLMSDPHAARILRSAAERHFEQASELELTAAPPRSLPRSRYGRATDAVPRSPNAPPIATPPRRPRRRFESPNRWNIYHIKGTPAVLLGHVEAPDEESAIKRAIEEFKISPALQKRLLAQRRA